MPFFHPAPLFVILNAHFCHPASLFVILSEAKDLPSGIRLWKTLRQAQGDKAVLFLGRCFDKLSMTRPAQHDKTTTPETKKASENLYSIRQRPLPLARLKRGFLRECAGNDSLAVGQNDWLNLSEGVKCCLHPDSPLYLLSLQKMSKIVYTSIPHISSISPQGCKGLFTPPLFLDLFYKCLYINIKTSIKT